jgi:hypothetical protein
VTKDVDDPPDWDRWQLALVKKPWMSTVRGPSGQVNTVAGTVFTVTRSSQPLPVESPYKHGGVLDVSSCVKVYMNDWVPPSVGTELSSHNRPVSVTVRGTEVRAVVVVIGRL